MKLAVHPRARCVLSLDGREVTLSASELAALGDLLPGDAEPSAARAALRALFQSGIAGPADAAPAGPREGCRDLGRLALSPSLRLGVALRDASPALAVDAAIAAFLEPAFVELIEGLAAAVDEHIRRLAVEAAVRGVALPTASALPLLHRAARAWLEARADARAWLSWSRAPEPFRLEVAQGARIERERGPSSARLVVAMPGARRDVVVPAAELPDLARVFDALRAGGAAGELEELGLGSVRRVLDAIDAIGGLCPRAPAPARPRADPAVALTLTPMGHAGLILDGGERRVLVDPWLFPRRERYVRAPLTAVGLGTIDAIAFTHHHDDHLDLGSLLQLPHDVPVFVPRDTGGPFGARLTRLLHMFGFRDVRELSPGERAHVDDLTLEAVPFFGEARDRLGWDATCYAVSRAGRNVLLHADASPDSAGRSLLGTGALDELVGRLGRLDVVFGTWWQARTFACSLSPLSLLCDPAGPEGWLSSTERCDCSLEFVRDLCRRAGASLFVLYAEGGDEGFRAPADRAAPDPAATLFWRDLEQYREAVAPALLAAATPGEAVILPREGPPDLRSARAD